MTPEEEFVKDALNLEYECDYRNAPCWIKDLAEKMISAGWICDKKQKEVI